MIKGESGLSDESQALEENRTSRSQNPGLVMKHFRAFALLCTLLGSFIIGFWLVLLNGSLEDRKSKKLKALEKQRTSTTRKS